jgi:hypothetical protein
MFATNVHKSRIKALDAAEIDAATFTSAWQVVATGFAEPCFMVRVINASNVGVDISFNESTMHDHVRAGSEISLSSHGESNLWFAKGMPVYVRGVAGVGRVIVAGYYY